MHSKSKLYLIPVTIAENAQHTIPAQVREVIGSVNVFFVENIRTARRFIASLKLGLVIETMEFHVLDKKTSAHELSKMMSPYKINSSIGILSESGCPGIADPGSLAASWAHQHNVAVVPLAGPSSIILALMASGLNGQKFCFHGYLPIEKRELEKKIVLLESESGKYNQTQLFIETPYRNRRLFDALMHTAHKDTMLCIAKDLTGSEEEVRTLTIGQWKSQAVDLHKVPTVFLMYAGR